jgi:large repetitive protein
VTYSRIPSTVQHRLIQVAGSYPTRPAIGAVDFLGSLDPGSSLLPGDTWTQLPAAVPGVPTIGVASGGNLSASVAFTPASTGGAATGFTATSTPGSITATGSASPLTVTGLTNGTGYTFTVHATNTAGSSAESAASNSVTPAASSSIGRAQSVSSHPANGSTGALAYSSAVSTGSLLVALVNCAASAVQRNTATVVDTVNGSWTKAAAALYTESGWLGEVSIWYRANTAAGTPTVTADFGNVSTICMSLVEYTGMPTSITVDRTVTNSDTGTSHATGNTTTTAIDLLIGGFGDWGSNNAYTAGSGWTKVTAFENSSSIQCMLEDRGVGSTGATVGTYSATCTTDSSNTPANILVAIVHG